MPEVSERVPKIKLGDFARCYGSHLVPKFNSGDLSTEFNLGRNNNGTFQFANLEIGTLQETLIEEVLLSPQFNRYPPPTSFQRTFWKAIITWVESADEEVRHEIYDRYIELLQNRSVTSGPPSPAYITHFYSLPAFGTSSAEAATGGFSSITLLESQTTIESGTTGLRTWRASYVLGDWILANADMVASARVLELGSGTGFLGILTGQLQTAAQTSTSAQKLWLTDIHSTVIDRCKHNIALETNHLQKHQGVVVHTLDWADCIATSPEFTQVSKFMEIVRPDIVLGADLVYDDSIIPALVAAISLALRYSERSMAFIASSIRRPSTFITFKKEAELANLIVTNLPLHVRSAFLLADDDHSRGEGVNTVVLLRITRRHA
ncbi:hypothetical protein FRC03_002799 [Tulasnella sp. 419]|nr:hypothetical protein FRC03_002799 [Tulasnella sp. 419]